MADFNGSQQILENQSKASLSPKSLLYFQMRIHKMSPEFNAHIIKLEALLRKKHSAIESIPNNKHNVIKIVR